MQENVIECGTGMINDLDFLGQCRNWMGRTMSLLWNQIPESFAYGRMQSAVASSESTVFLTSRLVSVYVEPML